MTTWPGAVIELPTTVWAGTPGSDRLRTAVRIDGMLLDVHAVAVADDADGFQSLVDPTVEEHLLTIYNPGAPFQTYRAFGRDYVLYLTPAADQSGPAAAECHVPEDAWTDKLDPSLVDYEQLLVTLVVKGHCFLHLAARQVTGVDQIFDVYPEDALALEGLAGYRRPYATREMFDRTYVYFATPAGN